MSVHAIRIDTKRCKKCGICAAYCKQEVFVFDGENSPEVKNIDKCGGCRMCENICPDFAIEVEVMK